MIARFRIQSNFHDSWLLLNFTKQTLPRLLSNANHIATFNARFWWASRLHSNWSPLHGHFKYASNSLASCDLLHLPEAPAMLRGNVPTSSVRLFCPRHQKFSALQRNMLHIISERKYCRAMLIWYTNRKSRCLWLNHPTWNCYLLEGFQEE